jgi:hypothetical protein
MPLTSHPTPEALYAALRAAHARVRDRELSEAYDYWKLTEADAQADRVMIAWQTEDRAYNAMVRTAYGLGYRPNNIETCAQWVARRLGRTS